MNMTIVLLNAVLIVVAAIGFAACFRELRGIRRGLGALDDGAGRRTASLVTDLKALREPLGAIRAAVEELSPNRRDTVEQQVPPVHDASAAPPKADATGLRLDLPRAGEDDGDSDGETRLMRPPTAEELAAAGAVPPPIAASPAGGPSPAPLAASLTALRRGSPASGPPPHPPPVKRRQTVMGLPPPAAAPPLSTHRPPPPAKPEQSLRPVCRNCQGSGAVRGLDNRVADCQACRGSGYLDPTAPPEHAAGMGDTERRTEFIG